MEIIERRITLENVEKPLIVIPIGDVHYGNINVDIQKFKETIEYIRTKENCYTILMGDMCEGILPSDKRFDPLTVAPELRNKLNDLGMTQYINMKNMLLPIRDKILVAVDGNHGDTLYRKYHCDFDAWLARELNTYDMGTSGFIKLKWDREQFHTTTVTIFVTHGWFAGRKYGAKVNNMLDLAGMFDANIYLAGHSHSLFVVSRPKLYAHGNKIIEQTQYFANTGTFLKTYQQGSTSYAEQAMYPPTKTGVVKISIEPSSQRNNIHMSE